MERIVYNALVDGAQAEIAFEDYSADARIQGRVVMSKAEMNRRLDELVLKLREKIAKRLGP